MHILQRYVKLFADNLYSFSVKNDSDYKAYDEVMGSRNIKFKVELDKEEEFILGIPGEYNIYNALGAIGVCHKLGISIEAIKEGIENDERIEFRYATHSGSTAHGEKGY